MATSHLFTVIGGLAALSIFLVLMMTVFRSKEVGNKKAQKKVADIQAKLSTKKR